MTKPKRKIAVKKPDALFGRVVSILEQARGNVVRAVNTNMVLAYWLIGREIVQELQGGKGRAKYGEQVVEDLSARLTARYGQGFSAQTLWKFRLFYQAYVDRISILSPTGIELGDTGILSPMGIELPQSSPAGTKSHETRIPHPLGAELEMAAIPSPTGTVLMRPEEGRPAGDELPQGFSPQLSWSHSGGQPAGAR